MLSLHICDQISTVMFSPHSRSPGLKHGVTTRGARGGLGVVYRQVQLKVDLT